MMEEGTYHRPVTVQPVGSTSDKAVLASMVTPIRRSAEEITARYEREELVRARHFYNSTHLVAFWRWHCGWVETHLPYDASSPDFPVFALESGVTPGEIRLKLIDPAVFEQFFFWKVSDHPPAYKLCRLADKDCHVAEWSIHKSDDVEQLLGRLTLLSSKWKEYVTLLYNRFLSLQCLTDSSTWNDYKIHLFLDLFLYPELDAQNLGASFDNIFFSNNLIELGVYLRYCLEAENHITADDVSAFLERQRKYYIQLAMIIDHEQNAFLNNFRHLMYYEPERGVVVMPELSDDLRDSLHQKLMIEAGVVKADGCPFAKSKGVSENAVLEHFTWFDTLMLTLVRRWLD